MLKLEVNNVNIKIVGDLTAGVVNDLSTSMTYKTNEFNGYTFVVLEHHLFNRVKQTFPTGLYSNAAAVLDSYNLNYEIIDKRIAASVNKPLKLYEVTPHQFQKKIIADAIDSQRFVIQVATGGGKTVIAAAILAQLNVPSIFVVHTGDLFEQSYDELRKMLKVPIGRIGGGLCDIQQINVCMVQTIHAVIGKEYIPFDEVEKDQMANDEIVKKSVIRNKQIEDFLKTVQCILIDECHHLRSTSYVNVMKFCKSCYYKGGLCLHKTSKIKLSNGKSRKIGVLYRNKIVDVITFNIKKKIFENKKARITKTPEKVTKNKRLLKIIFRDVDNNHHEIICSAEHKFYLNSLNKFVCASDLKVNDELFMLEKINKYANCKKHICEECKKEFVPKQKHLESRKFDNDYLMSKLSFLLYDDPSGVIEQIEIVENNEKHLYDVTILDDDENCHNFFANDVLVHNSATPESGDGRDMILQAYAGKIIGKISASYLIKNGYLVRPTIFYLRGSKNESYKFSRKRYNSIYKTYIVNNKYRNGLIVDCVKRLVDLHKTVLITVTLKRHGRLLLDLLKKENIDVQFIYGGVDKLKRKEYINQIRKRQLSVIIGTSLSDEGLNIPTLDALILAGSGKSPTRQIQRIGRVLRIADGKTEAVVIDFKDCVRYLTGHYKKRRAICEQEPEFKIVEAFD